MITPDGSTLYTTYPDHALAEIDIATGAIRRTIEMPPGSDDPTFRPNGGPLLLATDGTLYVESFGYVHAWDGSRFERLHGWAFASSPQRLVASHAQRVMWATGNALVRYRHDAPATAGVQFADST